MVRDSRERGGRFFRRFFELYKSEEADLPRLIRFASPI